MKKLLSGLFGAKPENIDSFEMSCQKYVAYLLLLLPVLTFLLVACGGGGGGQQSHP
ncbi:MAG: hypothetical protein ACP5U1_08130 [Desulfomonilaceae bacterium]